MIGCDFREAGFERVGNRLEGRADSRPVPWIGSFRMGKSKEVSGKGLVLEREVPPFLGGRDEALPDHDRLLGPFRANFHSKARIYLSDPA